MNTKLLIIFLLSIVFLVPVYSQEKDTTSANKDTVSTDTNEEWETGDYNWGDLKDNQWDKIGSHIFDFKLKGAPAIEFYYGASKMNLKTISEKFVQPGMLELKIGYTKDRTTDASDYISNYQFAYFHLSNFTPDLGNEKNNIDMMTNSWRFGLGWASGYGYRLGCGISITPYHQYSVDWTRVDMLSAPTNAEDAYVAGLFDNSFRFGNSFEGGVKIKLFNYLGIDAGYERSIVFPRHLFWKWGGGVIIESVGQGLVDKFVDEVLDSSPYAAPIVNFLLKNALSYGLYELRQDKMNWPFETTAPLAFDQFKVGITFEF
jgi:hypothetical protein